MPRCRRRTQAEQNVFRRVTNVPLITDVAGSFWAFLDFSIVLRSHQKPLNVSDFSTSFLVLPDRIELSTSPLPRECSTTELRQRRPWRRCPRGRRREAGQTCHKGCQGARISGCDGYAMQRILARAPYSPSSRRKRRRRQAPDCRYLPEQLSRGMTKASSTGGSTTRPDGRAERLAAALKANLQRRKAQARQRAAEAEGRDAESAPAHDSARVVADKRSA